MVRLYSRSVLYEKAQRPTAPDPAEAAPTQQQQQAVLQAPQGVPAIYVNIVQQPAAAAPPGAGAQVEQLAALMQEVLARLPPADAAAVQRQAEGRLHAPPPQPQLEPSAAQAAPAPKPPAVVQPQPVQQIAVAQPEHARVPAAMRHLFPQPAGLASGAPRTAAGAPPHAAMAQPHAVQQQLPAPTVLARQLLPPGRAPQAPAARAEPECVYCLDTAASVALIPCGHVVLCRWGACRNAFSTPWHGIRLLLFTHGPPALFPPLAAHRECAATLLELPHAACPVCRVAATGSLRVFT